MAQRDAPASTRACADRSVVVTESEIEWMALPGAATAWVPSGAAGGRQAGAGGDGLMVGVDGVRC